MGRGSWFAFFLLFVVAVFGFVLGSRYQLGVRADKGPYKQLEKFAKVLEFVEANYVEVTNPDVLIDGAIKGLLSQLDPHSTYLSQQVFRDMKEETSGKFGGLGIEVSITDGVISVLAPIDDTPASRAGLESGDQILSIGSSPTKSMSVQEAINLMRGKPGTAVSISVLKKSSGKKVDLTLTREAIRVASVRSLRLSQDIGYFRLSSFIERTTEDFLKSYEKMTATTPIKGILLDLRGNPGGLLEQAVKLSNVFIDEGPIVYTIGRDKSKQDIEMAQKGRRTIDLPMVILVDGSSASASEIVAGALQDYGRAVIAGSKTFGKGSVQQVVPLGDDSGMKLTVSRYYTPSGRSIQVKGIDPDVQIDDIDPKIAAEARSRDAKRLREINLKGHFENEAESDAELMKPLVVRAEESDADLKPLSFEERVDQDYMVAQARGLLTTMAVLKGGIRKPEFKLDEAKADIPPPADVSK